MRNSRVLCVLALAGVAALAWGQPKKGPATSQSAVTIEGNNISVHYAGAAMNGRKIFGGVVPYKQVWKLGEVPAAFHTDADLIFKGATVPEGDYTLYVMVDAGAWQLIINRASGARADTYHPQLDVGRVPMTLSKPSAPVENCKVTVTKTAALAGKLEVAWENVTASTPFHLDRVAGDVEW